MGADRHQRNNISYRPTAALWPRLDAMAAGTGLSVRRIVADAVEEAVAAYEDLARDERLMVAGPGFAWFSKQAPELAEYPPADAYRRGEGYRGP